MYVTPITPGATLTYLATPPLPEQFFMGAKSFIGTPEMQRVFVVKDKLFCTMKSAWFPWQQLTRFLSIGCTYKIGQISAVTCTYPRPLNLVSFQSLDNILSPYEL